MTGIEYMFFGFCFGWLANSLWDLWFVTRRLRSKSND